MKQAATIGGVGGLVVGVVFAFIGHRGLAPGLALTVLDGMVGAVSGLIRCVLRGRRRS